MARRGKRCRHGSLCTNEVMGLYKIIKLHVDDTSGNLADWTGEATVEYVNHDGGIDRTNLYFRFGSVGTLVLSILITSMMRMNFTGKP